MEYKYDEAMELECVSHLKKSFKKTVVDGSFNFIVMDSINEKITDYDDMWSFATSKGFKVYICEMDVDAQVCTKHNIHKRSEDDINRIIDYFEPTPDHHHKLSISSLQNDEVEEISVSVIYQNIFKFECLN